MGRSLRGPCPLGSWKGDHLGSCEPGSIRLVWKKRILCCFNFDPSNYFSGFQCKTLNNNESRTLKENRKEIDSGLIN